MGSWDDNHSCPRVHLQRHFHYATNDDSWRETLIGKGSGATGREMRAPGLGSGGGSTVPSCCSFGAPGGTEGQAAMAASLRSPRSRADVGDVHSRATQWMNSIQMNYNTRICCLADS